MHVATADRMREEDTSYEPCEGKDEDKFSRINYEHVMILRKKIGAIERRMQKSTPERLIVWGFQN